MFIILLFIFLLILIIANIILLSCGGKKLVHGGGTQLVYGGNKQLVHGGSKKLVYGGSKKLVYGGSKLLVHGGSKQLVHGGSKKSSNHPSGWQLYTLENCSHCDEQMKKLGGFNTYIKYKEDGNDILVNNIDGPLYPKPIDGFPFWYNSITTEERYGGQEMDNLLTI